MIVVKTATSVCSIPQKGTKRIECIEQINESANILKQVAEDAPGLKTSNYSLTLSYPINTLCTPQKHANTTWGRQMMAKTCCGKTTFHASCFCYLPTRKYYSIESSLFTFWSDRRVEIGMATSWLQAVGRLRLPLWGAAHQTSQFGLAKVLVKVDHSCGCERCGQVTGLLSIHWLFLQMVEELFSLLPSLVASLCDWRSFLISRWSMLSLSWLVQGSGRLLNLVGHGWRNQM